jgi:Family of unknown function (DUF5670)
MHCGAGAWLQALGAVSAKVVYMPWTIFILVLVLWILGFSIHVAGGVIHLLLAFALAILIFNLVIGRKRVL